MEETTGTNVTPPPFFFRKTEELKKQIGNIIVGQEKAVELILTAILADGHLLIEGVPGTAKTLLAKLVSKLIDAQFSRVQFTPDLMPSDVLGTTVFNMQNGTFDFHRGPVFADIILVDEINRAPAKTQSALFEVMEERQVTIDGTTYPMGEIYTIIATQNPVEHEGTYRLPEVQLDRFLFKIEMEYPNLAEEAWILERHNQENLSVKVKQTEPILTKEELFAMRREMRRVFIEPTLIRYIASLVYHSRNSKAIYLGASPRASVALLQASKAYAILQGRDFVTPGDIQFLTVPVFRHRLILTAEVEMEGYTTEKVIRRLIEKVEVPQ
ncbi:MAG: MoxR family ATPase [Bacteroides sp.]|nr:MoxR family ATPase [Bacteroides sp.]